MKKFRKPLMLLFLAAVFATLTRCENEVEEVAPPQSFKVIGFDGLPTAIQSEVTTTEAALKTAYAHKKDKPFGEVVATRIHQRTKSDGNTSYTLALTRATEDFYYDNLVINEDAKGNLKTHIIRYQPTPLWFYKHKTEGLGYEAYSGAITVFNEAGDLLSSIGLISGKPEAAAAKTVSSKANETNCEIIDIQEAGLLQDGVFYVYAITITVDCSGTGGGGFGNGGDDGMDNGFDNDGFGGSGDGSPEGGDGSGLTNGIPIDTVPVEEDDQIIIDPEFSEDYPCQAAIVQEVYSNCAPLSQLFQDIFEGNDTFNVTFTAEQLQGILDGGDTDGETPNNYLIRLNTLRLNQSTELDIINTATHEYVHALMYHYFYQGQFQLPGAGNPPTYAELAEGFAKHRAGFGGDHHPYIASLVNDIAEVTYLWAIDHGGYDPNNFAAYDNNPADGIDGLEEFLRQLAWGGLEDTPSYDYYYPDGTLEEQAIQKLIQDEIFPDDTDTTPKGNLPVPCN